MKRWLLATLVISSLILLSAPTLAQSAGTTVITGIVPFEVFNPASSSVTATGATITWASNADANSQVFYDTVAHPKIHDYPKFTNLSSTQSIFHSQSLVGLTASTVYHYRVQSVSDIYGIAYSTDMTFTTSSKSGILAFFRRLFFR